MAKYRKKPIVIEAICNDGTWPPIIKWLDMLAGGIARIPFGTHPVITRNENGSVYIETLEGTIRGNIGDWIICGVNGELYPCKPDIFEQTYESVGE